MGILNSHSHQTLLLFYVCRIYEYRITRTTQEKLLGNLETRHDVLNVTLNGWVYRYYQCVVDKGSGQDSLQWQN